MWKGWVVRGSRTTNKRTGLQTKGDGGGLVAFLPSGAFVFLGKVGGSLRRGESEG